MPIGKTVVTAASSDEEIIAVINAAGEHRHHWRRYDWPKPGENNTRAWVIPNDIGYSYGGNRTLLRRLHKMVKAGLLEVKYTDRRRQIDQSHRRVVQNGMPRFRMRPQEEK